MKLNHGFYFCLFFKNKLCLYIEIAIMDKIEKVIGKANNLCVSSIRHCLLKDKQRCEDQVDATLTPIKDWIKVRIKGAHNNNFHPINGSLISLFSRFWFIEIVKIRRRNAIKRCPETVYELSRLITVNAPREAWTKTKNSNRE